MSSPPGVKNDAPWLTGVSSFPFGAGRYDEPSIGGAVQVVRRDYVCIAPGIGIQGPDVRSSVGRLARIGVMLRQPGKRRIQLGDDGCRAGQERRPLWDITRWELAGADQNFSHGRAGLGISEAGVDRIEAGVAEIRANGVGNRLGVRHCSGNACLFQVIGNDRRQDGRGERQ